MHPHLPYWLAAIHMHVQPNLFLNWLSHFDHIEALFNAEHALLKKLMSPAHENKLQHPYWEKIKQDLTWMQETSQTIICFEDNNYPTLLKQIYDPPLVLYVQGNVLALLEKQIAIVGSRRPSPYGIQNAEKFAQALVQAGIVITSGMARGIDKASHIGALRGKGVTIAVAGTGLHQLYPPEHSQLREQILHENGAIISEFPLSTPPLPANFPKRNRIISGLSQGVLVIEAALKSGSLITAHCAVEQGREVYAIPGSINNPQAKGCHYLLRNGAKFTESADDILEDLLPHSDLNCDAAVSTTTTLKPELRSVLDQIDDEITPLDVIILRSGLTASQVSSILLTLELEGYVELVAGGYIRIYR